MPIAYRDIRNVSVLLFGIINEEKNMKRKRMAAPKERNQFVAAALFRKAGAHGKTRKAIRRKEKMDIGGEALR